MTGSVKHTVKSGISICTDRLPAFAAIIERAALGKVIFCKFNIRYQLVPGAKIIAHIVQMRLIGNQIGIIRRSRSAKKLLRILLFFICMG